MSDFDSGNRGDPKTNSFPPIPTPRADLASLLRTVQALKEAVEILTGARGSGQNAAVLRKDK